jgi:hypothetical protein
MFDWLEGLVADATDLAQNFAVLVAIASIIMVWYKTKALVPVLAAVLLAGIALWAVSDTGTQTLTNWIGDSTTGAIVVVDLAFQGPGGS